MSGDSSLVSLPSYNFSGDQSINFFSFLLENIEEVFLNDSESSLVLPVINEKEIVLNTIDFNVLPDSFKNLLTGYQWAWVCIFIMKDLRKEFENLKNGDFEKIASDDINANLV